MKFDTSAPLNMKLLFSENLEELREALLDGADVNTRYPQETNGLRDLTPLMIAVMMDRPEVVKLLLTHGADVNARTRNQKLTALHMAAAFQNVAMTQVLLEHWADPDIGDHQGNTPLHHALSEKRGAADVVRLLLQRGATADAQNQRGQTALMAAAHAGLLDILTLLLEAGAEIDLADDEQKTAYMAAKEAEQYEAAHILFRHGARVPLSSACMAVSETPTIRSSPAPILSLTARRFPHDTEPVVCDDPDSRWSREYHGTGLPLRQHPCGESIINNFGEDRIRCDACGSADVLVVAYKWSIHPMQGDFYADCEVVCRDCRHFTSLSASTY